VPFRKIVCLAKLIPDQTIEFIWTGQILLQKMTSFCPRVKPLSSILVLPDDIAERQAALSASLAATKTPMPFTNGSNFQETGRYETTSCACATYACGAQNSGADAH
jgi:hypothetical protein